MRPPHLDAKRKVNTSKKSKGCYYSDYGTPGYIIDAAKRSLGIEQFDFDLASSADANEIVGARSFCSRSLPLELGLTFDVWFNGKYVWCNPPGPLKSVKYFWDQFRYVEYGAFLLFSIDHLRHLDPLYCADLCFLRRRVQYVGADQGSPFSSVLIVNGMINRKPLEYIGVLAKW